MLEMRGSTLINETPQGGPAYARRSSQGPRAIPPLPIAQGNQPQKLKFDRGEEEKLFNDDALNGDAQKDPAFFLTEDPNRDFTYQ